MDVNDGYSANAENDNFALSLQKHTAATVVVCDTGIDPTSVNTGPVQIAM